MKISFYTSKFIILYYSFAVYASNYNALIFDRSRKFLIEVPTSKIPKDAKSELWASACPAEDKDETDKKFNEEKSFYKNALFVRQIYSEINQQKFSVNICDKPFKLSIASYDQRSVYYEFGYEIYFNKSDEAKFTLSDKSMYSKFQDIMQLTSSPTKLGKFAFNAVKSGFKSVLGRKKIKQDKEKGFMWIPVFKVRIMHRQLRRIKYDIRKNNRQPMIQCDDYSLGKEMFYNIDADEFYSRHVQKKIFQKAELPTDSEVACENRYECFEKWSLIPTDQFQFGSSTLPTCSNVTTIPIWSRIMRDILKKVDNFLYALSRVSEKPLRIIAGVHKYLLLPSKKVWPPKKLIALKKDGFSLFVPKIIYKLVKFKLNNFCKDEDSECWTGVIILIHNNPNFKEEHRICEDKTEKLGWTEITMYETVDLSRNGVKSKAKSKYIYVCAIRQDSIERVGLTYNRKLSTGELSLKNFPGKPKILKELEKLFSLDDEKVIERPSFDDENFHI
ncbi:uncharacterized protein LOC135841291 [Planococcus citri]|uniref:uncharacterized protein LOC135841291 n=1 Tax=Planococcus citri TaxID=170843 RepID=UPI0031F979B3